MELPDHMEQVVGQRSHFQPGLVGFKSVAAGLVPAQSVLGLFDSIFNIGLAIARNLVKEQTMRRRRRHNLGLMPLNEEIIRPAVFRECVL